MRLHMRDFVSVMNSLRKQLPNQTSKVTTIHNEEFRSQKLIERLFLSRNPQIIKATGIYAYNKNHCDAISVIQLEKQLGIYRQTKKMSFSVTQPSLVLNLHRSFYRAARLLLLIHKGYQHKSRHEKNKQQLRPPNKNGMVTALSRP